MLGVLSHCHLPNGIGLDRLGPELAVGFERAFLAAETDLRQWMPSAASEQERVAEFVTLCSEAFDAATSYPYAITADDGTEVVGYINLTPEGDHCVLGYWVHPGWRGRGIARLAVDTLVDMAFATMPEIAQVRAELDAANQRSRRVLEEAGFRHGATFERPPRTSAETSTEWRYVRDRYPRGTTTDRLVLRDLERSHLEAMTQLWCDPEVDRFMDDFGPRTPAQVATWIDEARSAGGSDPWFRSWAIELDASAEVVGWIGFGVDGSGVGDVDFAFIVDARVRGQGYASEALRGAIRYCFTTLGASSFWGQCHPDNLASAGATQAAGLGFIGTVNGQRRFRVSHQR